MNSFYRRTFALAVAVLAVSTASAGYQMPEEAKSCVFLSSYGQDGRYASGSGFFLRIPEMDEPVVITCRHCVENSNSIRVRDIYGREYPVKSIYTFIDRDLAYIKVDNWGLAPLCLRRRSSFAGLTVSTPVISLGDSGGAGKISLFKGNIVFYYDSYFALTAQFYSGNSGGPVLVEGSGEAIGVASHGPKSSSGEGEHLAQRLDNADFCRTKMIWQRPPKEEPRYVAWDSGSRQYVPRAPVDPKTITPKEEPKKEPLLDPDGKPLDKEAILVLAQRGSHEAEYCMGRICEMEEDYKEAMEWYRKSAEGYSQNGTVSCRGSYCTSLRRSRR